MKKLSNVIVLVGVAFLLMSTSAAATYIDFRTDEPFITDMPNNMSSYSATIGSLTLTFQPLGVSATKLLYWDDVDGFGVKGGGYDADEIEHPEALKVAFSITTYETYYSLNDLFY